MTKYRKITKNEVLLDLEDKYGIQDIKFMKHGSEGDYPICEDFEYIIGEEKSIGEKQ